MSRLGKLPPRGCCRLASSEACSKQAGINEPRLAEMTLDKRKRTLWSPFIAVAWRTMGGSKRLRRRPLTNKRTSRRRRHSARCLPDCSGARCCAMPDKDVTGDTWRINGAGRAAGVYIRMECPRYRRADLPIMPGPAVGAPPGALSEERWTREPINLRHAVGHYNWPEYDRRRANRRSRGDFAPRLST